MELIVKHFRELSLDELYNILKIRTDVFIVEQGVCCVELDNNDQDAFHVFLKDGNKVVACARVLDKGVTLSDVAIGRVVCTDRHKGYAQQVLRACIDVAKQHYNAKCIRLHAQEYVQSLYQKVGFKRVGEVFMEDSIPHVEMLLVLE